MEHDDADAGLATRHDIDNVSDSRLDMDNHPAHLYTKISTFDRPYEVNMLGSRRIANDISSHCDAAPSSYSLHSPSSFPGFSDQTSPSQSLLSRASISIETAAGGNGVTRHGRDTSRISNSFATRRHTEAGLLDDPLEAGLLRHFVNHLAISFDLTDPSCHFRKIVPQRALNDPILMNAILAASARHLSRVSGGDPYIADKYHQKCIQHLIPILSDEAAVLDENLLASTVILRFLEEIDVPLSGKVHLDGAGHLIGAHAFVSAQEICAVSGGLRLAAFWVGLRQEIYVAFVNQRSVSFPLQHCNVDRSFGAVDEARFEELLSYAENWRNSIPPCFTPVYHRYADADSDAVFPEVMYLSDAVVTGIQHYHLTLILLRAYDPTIPRLGSRRTTALREMDHEIKHHTKMLCGLALSNSSTPPNFVTASMAVTMAGDKFTERKEQEACLRILETCEAEHGWSTMIAQEDLKEAWGWN
ncbi:hypothetical protein E4T48_07687 [Aureobasidium sp. EXF-10727]|nr:hypothetical protein E4T48_07687 [Aureobasidium sp. EXF-10727]